MRFVSTAQRSSASARNYQVRATRTAKQWQELSVSICEVRVRTSLQQINKLVEIGASEALTGDVELNILVVPRSADRVLHPLLRSWIPRRRAQTFRNP